MKRSKKVFHIFRDSHCVYMTPKNDNDAIEYFNNVKEKLFHSLSKLKAVEKENISNFI